MTREHRINWKLARVLQGWAGNSTKSWQSLTNKTKMRWYKRAQEFRSMMRYRKIEVKELTK